MTGYKKEEEAINIKGLTKRFCLRHHLPKNNAESKYTKPEIVALNDINLNVYKGEVLGIVGRNGSGKSTLLKILSGVLKPDKGVAAIHGSVNSVLDVGYGFHPDLTGNENIAFNASIAGLSNEQLKKIKEQIAELTALGDFLDEPVKIYSSGMYLRLAFATQIYIPSDILILDEVISVGDMEFRKRCAKEITEMCVTGKTVLVASHNPQELMNISNRLMWLDKGRIMKVGNPEEVLESYVDDVQQAKQVPPAGKNSETKQIDICESAANVEISGISINHKSVTELEIPVDKTVVVEVSYKLNTEKNLPDFVLNIYSQTGPALIDSPLFHKEHFVLHQLPGQYKMQIVIPPFLFNTGVFYFTLLLYEEGQNVLALENFCKVKFVPLQWEGESPWNKSAGVVPFRPRLKWEFRPETNKQNSGPANI